MQFRQAVAFIYSFAASWVPGLMRILPPDTIRLIFEVISASLEQHLKVDFKFNNWVGMVLTLKEITEAVVMNSPKERIEAAYSLLVLITDLETRMTLDEFSKRVSDNPKVAELL